ncbi:MAG: DNA N-6-adenine-methyltransferase, partial [Elusimicrobia bacterium]|nr:DNA N-6-adenine-methyltransferase [Elusimicrobiota bacterium]
MTELVLYNAARTALQKAVRVDEVKSIRDRAEAMRAYGKQANDRQMEADAFEIRERATKRLGELVKAQKALPREIGGGLAAPGMTKGTKREAPRGRAISGPNPTRNSTVPTLDEMGIDKHLADRARKLDAMPPAKFEKHIEAGRERVFKAHVGQATGESEWYTPAALIEAARDVMVKIDLDPASCAAANGVVGASRFFSIEDDGLSQDWAGRVFLNPPYSQPLMGKFAEKLVSHVKDGSVTSAIA